MADARRPRRVAGSGVEAHEATGVLPVSPLFVAWLTLVSVYVITSALPVRPLSVEVIRQAVYLAPHLGATIAMAFAARRGEGHARRLLVPLAIGLILVTISESAESVRTVAGFDHDGGWPPASNIATTLAAIVVIVALLRSADLRVQRRIIALRHLLDGVGVAIVWFGFVAWVLSRLVGPSVRAVSGEVLIAAGYAVYGLVILVAAMVAFLSRPGVRVSPWERKVLDGLGLYGLATTLWPLWYVGSSVQPSSHGDTLVEVLWMSGTSLAFAGILAYLRRPGDDVRFSPVPRLRPRRHALIAALVPAIEVLAIVLLGGWALTESVAPIRLAAGLSSAGLTVIIATRQVLLALENERLFNLTVIDPLTGLHGHRHFQERLQAMLDGAVRHGERVALMLMDLDCFQRVNDAFGHAHGDALLAQVAACVRRAARGSDEVCRVGGDEFGLALQGAGAQTAHAVAERIREALAASRGPDGAPLSASFGIAVFPDDAADRQELFRRARGALYWAKRHGRDRTVVFDAHVVQALDTDEHIARIETQGTLATIQALAAAVDARDPATQFHSRNVASLARSLADSFGFDEKRARALEIAALLHDVGKIGVSDAVLQKRGPLTPAEQALVREHVILGERILSSIQMREILPWVRHHHERWDGCGYPDGLAGDAIPFEARILAVCDAYDAMTSNRPYRAALSTSAALQELDLCMGTQFDPIVVEAFLRLVGTTRLLHEGDARLLGGPAPAVGGK